MAPMLETLREAVATSQRDRSVVTVTVPDEKAAIGLLSELWGGGGRAEKLAHHRMHDGAIDVFAWDVTTPKDSQAWRLRLEIAP